MNPFWRVGVLFSQTGVTSAVEKTQLNGTLLAISEVNASGGVRGRHLDPVIYDPKSLPKLHREMAITLCDVEGIRVVFGCHMSSARKAALPVIEAQNALLFYPHLYEGFEYSRNCIYTGATPSQIACQLVDYLVENYGKRVFLVGSDYVFPYESNRVVSDLFANRGGETLDEIYVPLDLKSDHIEAVIDRIRQSKPDVVYSAVVGSGIIPLFEAFRKAGFDPKTTPIASQSNSEIDFATMSPDAAEGHITAAPFFSTVDRPQARAFVKNYRRCFGSAPGAAAEAAYFQVHLYARALEIAGDDRADALLPALADVEVDAPQGPVCVDRTTNHTYLWPRIGRVSKAGVFEIVYESSSRAAPDPFMLQTSLVRVQPASVALAE